MVDTTQANDGDVGADGKEAHVPGQGNQALNLPADCTFTVSVAGGPTLKVELKGADAKLTLGAGDVHAAIEEAMEDWWDNTVKPALELWAGGLAGHTHSLVGAQAGSDTLTTAGAGSSLSVPSYDTLITSTKLAFPGE